MRDDAIRPRLRKRVLKLMMPMGPALAPARFGSQSGLILISIIALAFLVNGLAAQSWNATSQPGIVASVLKWLPLILFGSFSVQFRDGWLVTGGQIGGFALNVMVSIAAMAAGTVLGVLLGLALVSTNALLRFSSGMITQVFRNTPWLVLLFFAAFVLPFQIRVFGFVIPIPDWCKAAAALTLPIMANIAEVTRGAIRSIPITQWESAESLGFGRARTFRLVILPQCVRRMTPPWMNWYAILAMESSLISIVGVNEAMTMTHDALSAEGRSELLLPMYGLLLLLFFAYCYPIARWTQKFEQRFEAGG